MFLINPTPYPDETLLSFFYRTAEENCMINHNWIVGNYEEYYQSDLNPYEINWLEGEPLKNISDFLNIPFQLAQDLTLPPILKKLSIDIGSYNKNPWFLYTKVRCCPLCLQKKAYHRKSWTSSHSILCVEHNCFLIDSCSYCMMPNDIHSLIKGYYTKCKTATSTNEVINANDNGIISYQKYINNLLAKNSFKYTHSYINQPTTFLKTVEFFAHWSTHLLSKDVLSYDRKDYIFDEKAIEGTRLKNAKTITQSICIYSFAFKIIDNWPSSFYSFIQLVEIENKKKLTHLIKSVLPSLYTTDLEFITKEFSNYILYEREQLSKEEKYTNAEEIRFLSNKFNAGIKHSYLISEIKFDYLGYSIAFVKTNALEQLLINYESSITKDDLRERWGTSARATLAILKSKLLENAFNYSYGNMETWVIPINSIEKFEMKLNEHTKELPKDAINLNLAFQWIDPTNSHILLQGILENKITLHWKQGQLAEALISKYEVYLFVKEQLIEECRRNQWMPVRTLVFLLGVKKSDIYHWFKTGRFGAIQEDKPIAIPFNNYILFSESYLTTFEYGVIHKLKVTQVIKKHSMGHLKSVSGPNLQDGKRLLFLKGDIPICDKLSI